MYIIDPIFTIDVVAECARDLGTFEFKLLWDGTVAQAVDIRDGGFISACGRSRSSEPNVYPAAGEVQYGQISFGPNPGPNGDGVLAHIDFKPLKVDCAVPLNLQNVRASDTQGQREIPLVYGGALCVKDYALSSIGEPGLVRHQRQRRAGRG